MSLIKASKDHKVYTRLETAFSKSETLEEFYLKELETLQSRIKPEVFRIQKVNKKS